MQTLHTAAIHKLLSTPVQLDLGSTAQDIIVTRDRVAALPQAVAAATSPIAQDVRALAQHVSTEALRVINAVNAGGISQAVNSHATQEAQRVISTLTANTVSSANAIKASIAAEVKKVLDKLNAPPVPAPTPAAVAVNATSAPLLSLLTQVQTLALDATPGQPYKGKEPEFKGWTGENVAIHGLRDAAAKEAVVLVNAPQSLQARFTHAFDEFKGTDLPSRSRRFAEVHALIADVATFLA